MNEIKNLKNDLRAEYLKKRSGIDEALKKEMDRKIAAYFINSVSFRHADIILIYNSKPDETDTSEIIDYALGHGKFVACPVSDKLTNKLSFRLINSRGDLTGGTYGIMEPNDNCVDYFKFLEAHSDKNMLSVCISPGVVFDRSGYRIGYGKGYYDRFLSKFNGSKIGLCYSSCLIEKIPHGKFDIKNDVVITEKGIFVPVND